MPWALEAAATGKSASHPNQAQPLREPTQTEGTAGNSRAVGMPERSRHGQEDHPAAPPPAHPARRVNAMSRPTVTEEPATVYVVEGRHRFLTRTSAYEFIAAFLVRRKCYCTYPTLDDEMNFVAPGVICRYHQSERQTARLIERLARHLEHVDRRRSTPCPAAK